MNICSNIMNQALLTTEEAALYLGVPVSYLIRARSPKCQGCLIPPPRFIRLCAEKKGGKWIRYPRVELDRWLASLPLQEKAEIRKKKNETNDTLLYKNCVLVIAILKEEDLNKSGSKLLKSLTGEEKEKKKDL